MKKKTGQILAIVAISLTAFSILIFTGSILIKAINGGNGNSSEKVAAMMTAADKAAESDWKLQNRYDPKVDNGCLSIDTACLKLSASWLVDHSVDGHEVGARMGLNMDSAVSVSTSVSCTASMSSDGSGKTDICVYESKDKPGEYKVDIFMTQR